MIEGLKFDIEAEEMAAHLLRRAEHHYERSSFYAAQVRSLEQGKVEGMNYSGGDPVRALKDKEAEHLHKSQLFEFLRGHLVPGETYRLDESELVKLEFVKSKNWY